MRLLSYAVEDEDERLAVASGIEHAVDVEDLLGGGPWTMSRLLADPDGAVARAAAAAAAAMATSSSIAESARIVAPPPLTVSCIHPPDRSPRVE